MLKIIKDSKIKNKKSMSRRTRTKEKTSEKNDVHFAEGVSVFEPHKNAPEFVIANICINVDKFIEFIDSKKGEAFLKPDKKYGDSLNLVLKESKAGDLYLSINTFGTDADDVEEEEEEEEEKTTSRRRGKK